MGRKSMYTDDLGERIISEIENNAMSLDKIVAKNPDFPTPKIIREWVSKNIHPKFTEMYFRARINQSHCLIDKIFDVVQNAIPDKYGRIEKAALEVRTYQWIASKLNVRMYGDKPEIKEELPQNELTDSQKIDKIHEMLEEAKKRAKPKK